MAADVRVREEQPRIVGRYALFDEIAAGGMATVHLGRLVGPVGFGRTVAIKTLHPQFAKDPEFVEKFLQEARLASRVVHPNVVRTEDIATEDGEVFLVMEYVAGESLARLIRSAFKAGGALAPALTTSVISQTLRGLHVAHEAKNEQLEPLQIVHRDVSPQNILVGLDGVARIFDFGVAKAAAARSQATTDGQMKGKLSYMSPEQLNGKRVDRRTDVFAAGVVGWECLAGRRLFAGSDPGEVLAKVLRLEIPSLCELVPGLPPELSAVIMRALQRDPAERWETAQQFALELEQVVRPAPADVLSEWVMEHAQEALFLRERQVQRVERASILLSRAPSYGAATVAPAPAPAQAPVQAPAPSSMRSGRQGSAPPSLGTMAQMAVSGTATRNVARTTRQDKRASEGSGVARSALKDPAKARSGSHQAVWLTIGLTVVTFVALFLWLFRDGFLDGAPAESLPTAELYAVPEKGSDTGSAKSANSALVAASPAATPDKKSKARTAPAAPAAKLSPAAGAEKLLPPPPAAERERQGRIEPEARRRRRKAAPAAPPTKPRPRAKTKSKTKPRAHPSPNPAKPKPCAQPTQLGSDGIWRVKPQCM